MTSDDLVQNIQQLISDPSYKQKALEASRKFIDNPMHPLDEASFWIEYIARHKGATHLKSHGAFMPLYKYLLLNVFGCALLIAFVAIWLPLKILKLLGSLLRRKSAVVVHKKRQ